MKTGRTFRITCLTSAALFVGLYGCSLKKSNDVPQPPRVHVNETAPSSDSPYRSDNLPDLESMSSDEVENFAPPRIAGDQLPQGRLELTLDQAIEMALRDTKVLRGLSAQILNNPALAQSHLDPAIQQSDPEFGVEGALSQFDALVSTSLGYQKNDNVFNNALLGGGANEVQQDLVTSNFSLSKISATGSQFTLRGLTNHDGNNQPGNLFDHVWNTELEAEVRKPLLQGNGVLFNRIAGPNSRPGLRISGGVVIARINHDISANQFERGLQNYINEIITAYWNLYFAYRNFETVKKARDNALKTWNIVRARLKNKLPGGEADKESEAREQYYVFQSQLTAALNGDRRAGVTGVLQAESDLRRLLNIPQSDDKLLLPVDDPIVANTIYDWDQLCLDALHRRPEIKEQKWRVKQRELELFASKNFLLPRLDAVATFRNTGFGDDLIGGGSARFASAAKDAFSGDHNELEFGLQYSVAVGRRQAHAGVRNAELRLAREQAILTEQRKQVLQNLGSAIRQVRQSYMSAEFAYNRMQAAKQTVTSRQAAYKADNVPFDELHDAQRRLADAETNYYQELVNYELATETVALESGQLLLQHQVILDGAETSLPTSNVRRRRPLEKTPKPLDPPQLDQKPKPTKRPKSLPTKIDENKNLAPQSVLEKQPQQKPNKKSWAPPSDLFLPNHHKNNIQPSHDHQSSKNVLRKKQTTIRRNNQLRSIHKTGHKSRDGKVIIYDLFPDRK